MTSNKRQAKLDFSGNVKKLQKISSNSSSLFVWQEFPGILVLNALKQENKCDVDGPLHSKVCHIISFDLDGTLIETKSGKTFSTNPMDWKFLHPNVPKKLKEAAEDKCNKLVLFSNQAGVSSGKVTKDDLKEKIESIVSTLKVPILGLFAIESEGPSRKPGIHMWKKMAEIFSDWKIEKTNSIFVGDAAGRPASKGVRKDFSDSDLKFAYNVGIRFYTPEAYFLSDKLEFTNFLLPGFHAKSYLKEFPKISYGDLGNEEWIKNAMYPNNLYEEFLKSANQKLVILVGCPASGKTSFARRHLVPNGFEWINGDTHGSKAKLEKIAQQALKEGKNAVVDNTNGRKDVRLQWIDLATKYDAEIWCFNFVTSMEICKHANIIRTWSSEGKIKKIPAVAFHTFAKNYTEPEKEEGIKCIINVKWIPHFESEEQEEIFSLLT